MNSFGWLLLLKTASRYSLLNIRFEKDSNFQEYWVQIRLENKYVHSSEAEVLLLSVVSLEFDNIKIMLLLKELSYIGISQIFCEKIYQIIK